MDDQFLSGKRVLVVEDEMLVAMQIEDMLCDLGCKAIAVAGNADAALNLIDANRFDLATLDLNLNGTRSFAIAEALSDRHIPFAFATGYSGDCIDEAFGDRPVLNKPYTFFQFKSVLGQLLADGSPPLAA